MKTLFLLLFLFSVDSRAKVETLRISNDSIGMLQEYPHIVSFSINPAGERAAPYLESVDFCLSLIEEAGKKVIRADYTLKIDQLDIDTVFPISVGSTSERSIRFFGEETAR